MRGAAGDAFAVDDRDVQTVMEVLFDLQTRIIDIHTAILGDDDEEEAEE